MPVGENEGRWQVSFEAMKHITRLINDLTQLLRGAQVIGNAFSAFCLYFLLLQKRDAWTFGALKECAV